MTCREFSSANRIWTRARCWPSGGTTKTRLGYQKTRGGWRNKSATASVIRRCNHFRINPQNPARVMSAYRRCAMLLGVSLSAVAWRSERRDNPAHPGVTPATGGVLSPYRSRTATYRQRSISMCYRRFELFQSTVLPGRTTRVWGLIIRWSRVRAPPAPSDWRSPSCRPPAGMDHSLTGSRVAHTESRFNIRRRVPASPHRPVALCRWR
jgi:hypothetical protein